MNIVIDTNAYSAAARGDALRLQIFRTARQIHVPFIVLGELRAGFAFGNQKSTNEASLQFFLTSPRVSVLMPDEQTTHHYGHLYAQLRKRGIAIPTNDLWIAALAVQHNLVLCTSDAHFQHLPQVVRC